MERQTKLARTYGVYGFCFYWYWFNGRKPLAQPLERLLASGRPDFPFCLCWANEGWTRKWAGEDRVIFSHKYSAEDDLAHARDLARYFQDPRYIQIGSAPLLLIYRAGVLPDAPAYTKRWREMFRQIGVGEIHLAMVESAEFAWAGKDPRALGFDSALEFPPHSAGGALPNHPKMTNPKFKGAIFDYRQTVLRYATAPVPPYPRFRSVMCAWDNTARYQDKSAVFMNANPGAYRAWLEAAIRDAQSSRTPDTRLVFVNAWNEWGEGTYLEPDTRWGRGYLEATRDAITDVNPDATHTEPFYKSAVGAKKEAGPPMSQDLPQGYAELSELHTHVTQPLVHRGIDYLEFIEGVDRLLKPRSYLEIGTAAGSSVARVSCAAVCVDPNFKITTNIIGKKRSLHLYQTGSKEFFLDADSKKHFSPGPDLVFIDGMHTIEDVLFDFIHAEAICHPRSVILVHDCAPTNLRMAERTYRPGPTTEGPLHAAWTGDVWKIMFVLKTHRPDLHLTCLDCMPTGLLAVSGLSPASKVLHERYQSLVDEWRTIELDNGRLGELWAISNIVTSRDVLTTPTKLAALLGLGRGGWGGESA